MVDILALYIRTANMESEGLSHFVSFEIFQVQ